MIYLAAPHPFPQRLPYYETPSPAAGFSSPAADFVEGELYLNLHLVR